MKMEVEEVEISAEDLNEQDLLITRAKEYFRGIEDVDSEKAKKGKKYLLKSKGRVLKCRLHSKEDPTKNWHSVNSSCSLCCQFEHREKLPNGILPRTKHVIEYLLTLRRLNPGKGGFERIIAQDISMHWIYCNVYSADCRSIEKRITRVDVKLKKLFKYDGKNKNETYWELCSELLQELSELFDVVVKDKKRKKTLEKLWKVDFDQEFYDGQKENPPRDYCSTAVDRAWQIRTERKRKRECRARSEHYEFVREDEGNINEENVDLRDGRRNDQDEEWNAVEGCSDTEPGPSGSAKKRRIQVPISDAQNCEELPKNYRHIRTSIRKVRPEFYTAVDRMISELHMSKKQAVSAILITAKELFNIKWKTANEDDTVIDLDTAPQNFSLRKEGKAREILALNLIVDKIFECAGKSTVTYHDDGSRKQGVGAFSVQGITIDNEFYHFPTVTISSEKRENLADLKVLLLEILSTASGRSKQELWEKIDFTMTDSTTHNLEVDDLVSEILETDHVPGHLLCQVHPVMMFVREIQKLCKEVDAAIGPDKIFSSFAVTLSEVQSCVVQQWMDCVTRLVTHDFDQKSWNYADEFDIFIRPLKNPAKRLQQERFNSFVYSAAVVLWLDWKVSNFLGRFSNITNQLACLVRSFEPLDYLRVLAAVIVIVGVHLVEPFLSLTTSSFTTWEKLKDAFPKLYTDFTTTDPKALLDLTKPAFTFVSKERFESTLYKADLLHPAKIIINNFESEIITMIKLLLPKLARGWVKQRGEIFDFGGGEENENKLKVKNFDEEKLQGAPVHNLSSERSVGSVNYGLKIYGNKQLNIVSSSMVKASASSLLEGESPTAAMRKMVRSDGAIPQILQKWEDKQKELREEVCLLFSFSIH